MKKNFLLDADETVLDFVRTSRESLRRAMRELGLPFSEEDYALYKRINDGLWREYERGGISKPVLMRERFALYFSALGLQGDAEAANRVYFENVCRTGYLLEGAEDFLHALKGRGRVFLITNGTAAAQYGRLDALGIRGLFDGIYVSDEVGYAKPDPRFFAAVLRGAGLKREECVVIGDSPTSDIKGANNAGIPCIWYDVQGRRAEGAVPDRTAHSYREILDIIDKEP